MDRREMLELIRDEAELQSLKQADIVVRIVVGGLKTLLPEELAAQVEANLPEDLRAGWQAVEPYPSDILEREEMFFEGVEDVREQSVPTITDG